MPIAAMRNELSHLSPEERLRRKLEATCTGFGARGRDWDPVELRSNPRVGHCEVHLLYFSLETQSESAPWHSLPQGCPECAYNVKHPPQEPLPQYDRQPAVHASYVSRFKPKQSICEICGARTQYADARCGRYFCRKQAKEVFPPGHCGVCGKLSNRRVCYLPECRKKLGMHAYTRFLFKCPVCGGRSIHPDVCAKYECHKKAGLLRQYYARYSHPRGR